MKPVTCFLRKRDIPLILYLDDILIIGSNPQETHYFTQFAIALLDTLGFIINKNKSVLTSTQEITFLGFTINSMIMLFTLPPGEGAKIVNTMPSDSFVQNNFPSAFSPATGTARIISPSDMEISSSFRHLQALMIKGFKISNYNFDSVVMPSIFSRS